MPLLSFAQQNKLSRKYRAGDTCYYRMTTDVIHNGKWQSTIIAVCELSTITDSSNIPYDQIKWISKKVYNGRDTADHSSEISNTQPYRISLHPHGKLEIPPIRDAGMTGEITDFNTFFVAISPKLGIDKLSRPGDAYRKPENVHGNFGNGKDILKGEDCLAVTTSLVDIKGHRASVRTDFQPPSGNCLNYYTTEMQTPVIKDTINNFQMVRYASPTKVNLFYGREWFIVNSIIDTRDGKLQSAEMENSLLLTLKINCNTDFSDCQTSFPFTIQRKIKLELIPGYRKMR